MGRNATGRVIDPELVKQSNEIINKLGGKKNVATLLKFNPYNGVARVHHWTTRGIPPDFIRPLKHVIATGNPLEIAVQFKSSVPACANSEAEYLAWKRMARLALPGKHGFCVDCTIEYQSKMIRARRCENPGVILSDIED